MRKMKQSIKTALVSTLIITLTAAIAYATPKIIDSKNAERENKLKLAIEKVDGDTVKVALDNVQEIPKSLQFSIQLQGATLKEGASSIKDLIKSESESRLKSNGYSTNSNDILVDYDYNENSNTIDVLITSENSIPKVSNKIEIFELDVKPESSNAFTASELPTYKIVPSKNYEYKYVSNTNREYISPSVDYSDESISLNMSPIISAGDKYIELAKGEKLELTAENLGITMEDPDGNEDLRLEVKKDDVEIIEFVSDTAGVYNLSCTAIDNYGDRSETITVQIQVAEDEDEEEGNKGFVINASDRVIKVGEEFKALDGVTVTDSEGKVIKDAEIDVKIEGQGDASGETSVDTSKAGKYKVTYTVEINGEKFTKEITITVEADKLDKTLVINATDKVIKVGNEFNELEGVTVTDAEGNVVTDVEINVEIQGQGAATGETKVDTSKAGEYKVIYSVTSENGEKFVKQITITVKEDITLAENITIDNKLNKLYVGSSKTLRATINKEADIKDIEWTTSNENIASIQVIGNDAKVVAKSEGEVTITAKTKDGSNKSDIVTIDIVDFKNDNTLPSFIKDVIDNNVVKPISGTGEESSPLELEVQNIAVEEFDKFLKELENLEPNLVEIYEDGNFTVYKIKLSRKARLFRSSAEGYIEIRIDNRLVSANEYKASLDKLLANNQPEQPGQSGEIEKPGQGGNTNQGSNQGQGGPQENTGNVGTTEDENPSLGGIKLPETGQESISSYLGVAAVAIGGLLFGIKKKKK